MSKIKVKLLNIKEGLKEYDDIIIIRIKDKNYNLNIMRDYVPIIGEVDGMVEFQKGEETITLENVIGYYMNKKNQFNLFIKEVG